MSGKQIKLFLVDGTPGGLTTAEITNWTGHVLAARRSDLADLLKRDEAQRTGVYFLLGDDEAAVGDTRCYIGEADVVADRLRYHQRDKDFWDRVVVITSKDTNLTKSHGRYLESRLISLARQAGRVSLENSTAPPVPALPEADASDMDYFLSRLQIVLPVLGVNAIRVRPVKAPSPSTSETIESPVFRLQQEKIGVDAQAQQIDGEFTMLAGSIVVASWHGVGKADSTVKAYASYRAHHERLVNDGSIAVENRAGRVTRDIVFTSPSTAGAVALGRSCNGRREWIAGSETFGAWESRGVEWAEHYDGYQRLARTPERLSKLIQPARNSFRTHGRVPDWCGVDFLRGWAFHLVRAPRHAGQDTLDDEWSAVLDALRRHPDAEPHERPPALRPRVASIGTHRLPTTFSASPKMHRDPEFLSRKQERLWEPHVAPINSFVERIRAERGQYVPYIDPDSGGASARVLFVLESPAKPASHGSGMLSTDNDDGTAANIWAAYHDSGLPRTHGLHWNAVPWYVGDGVKEKKVSSAQVESGHLYLLDLLKLAPDARSCRGDGQARSALTAEDPDRPRWPRGDPAAQHSPEPAQQRPGRA